MRLGRRVAIDVGKARIGVAASDFHGILASGVSTVSRDESADEAIEKIQHLISEIEPIEIYVGLPLNLQGGYTASTRDAIDFAQALINKVPCELRFIDERMTTNTASNALKLSGRDSKSGRQIIDQIAATVILEQALTIEKNTGLQPGYSMGEIVES